MMYAYVLQDPVGRFVTMHNRMFVLDVDRPRLYKTECHAIRARYRLRQFNDLEVKCVKLEVLDDNVHRTTRGAGSGWGKSNPDSDYQTTEVRMEENIERLPIGTLQDAWKNQG